MLLVVDQTWTYFYYSICWAKLETVFTISVVVLDTREKIVPSAFDTQDVYTARARNHGIACVTRDGAVFSVTKVTIHFKTNQKNILVNRSVTKMLIVN